MGIIDVAPDRPGLFILRNCSDTDLERASRLPRVASEGSVPAVGKHRSPTASARQEQIPRLRVSLRSKGLLALWPEVGARSPARAGLILCPGDPQRGNNFAKVFQRPGMRARAGTIASLRMLLTLHLAWVGMTVLRFAGVVVLFAGVALFGVYFIAGNARATDGAIPRSSWLGPGPRKGMGIIALGVFMLLAAFIIGRFMPNGA